MFGLVSWSQARDRPFGTKELSFAFIFIDVSSNLGELHINFLAPSTGPGQLIQMQITSTYFISRPVKDFISQSSRSDQQLNREIRETQDHEMDGVSHFQPLL